jgi:lysozyme family protein
MSADRFETCLARVLVHEGGWSNHPSDPGGATMKGVTQRVYDAWRKGHGLPPHSVRLISEAELAAIYRRQYWDKAGRGLPVGLDYAVFDYAVNSGAAQAARDLQRVLGVEPDGIIGAMTIAAAQDSKAPDIVSLCNRRLRMLKGLRTWGTFGKGWQKRVDSVLMTAVADATGQRIGVKPEPAPGQGNPADKSAARTVTEVLTDKDTLATIGGVVGSAGALASGSGPIQWAVAAVLVLAAVTGAVLLLRRAKA